MRTMLGDHATGVTFPVYNKTYLPAIDDNDYEGLKSFLPQLIMHLQQYPEDAGVFVKYFNGESKILPDSFKEIPKFQNNTIDVLIARLSPEREKNWFGESKIISRLSKLNEQVLANDKLFPGGLIATGHDVLFSNIVVQISSLIPERKYYRIAPLLDRCSEYSNRSDFNELLKSLISNYIGSENTTPLESHMEISSEILRRYGNCLNEITLGLYIVSFIRKYTSSPDVSGTTIGRACVLLNKYHKQLFKEHKEEAIKVLVTNCCQFNDSGGVCSVDDAYFLLNKFRPDLNEDSYRYLMRMLIVNCSSLNEEKKVRNSAAAMQVLLNGIKDNSLQLYGFDQQTYLELITMFLDNSGFNSGSKQKSASNMFEAMSFLNQIQRG